MEFNKKIAAAYDKAINEIADSADSRDIDRLYSHLSEIIKKEYSGFMTESEAIRSIEYLVSTGA